MRNIDNNHKEIRNCIYVVGHKEFQLPMKDTLYIPLMVGNQYAQVPVEYLRDCEGDSITDKNPRYNELTGLYWIWKNSSAEIVGMCHYRRYFTTGYGKLGNVLTGKSNCFITEKQIVRMLQGHDVILHNKTFMPEGNRNQLCIKEADDEQAKKSKLRRGILQLTDKVFARMYPQDVIAYERVMNRKYAHLLNVVICRKELLDRYCEWLFPLLFAVEKEIDKEFPGEQHDRCMGLLAERMLDVWVEKKHLRVKECFTVNTERIDWKIW